MSNLVAFLSPEKLKPCLSFSGSGSGWSAVVGASLEA